MKRLLILLALVLTIAVIASAQDIPKDTCVRVLDTDTLSSFVDYSYPTVPDAVKEYFWDQAEKYAEGVNAPSNQYYFMVTDFYNGAMFVYLEMKKEE